MRIINVPSADSTNSLIRKMSPLPEDDVLVAAHEQTSGRGQRGNSWEAECGKNLTFSILYHPKELLAKEQFLLSCALSMAIADVLGKYISPAQGEVRIKWPNDIYVDNQKICGILIENSLAGKHIQWSILGVGININQERFLSDAPNPVSLRIVTGKSFCLEALLAEFAETIERRLACLGNHNEKDRILTEYLSRLWRKDLWSEYRIPGGEDFLGRITNVYADGVLAIEDSSGTTRKFLFKEVQFIL